MSEIKVQVIYKNGVFLGACNATQGLNCDRQTNSARIAWLKRNPYYAGSQEEYEITFKDPKTSNSIKGVWAEFDGIGVLLDAALNGVTDINALINACNVCCGTTAVVAGYYNGTYPSYFAPVAKTYTVVRTDDGSILALENFMLDYFLMISGTLIKLSRDNTAGTTTYQFQAYTDPVPVLTDTITETARTFDSNTPPTLTGGNVFFASGNGDGTAYNVRGTATLADLATALNADTIAKTFGTWSIVSGKVHLVTTTVDNITIVVGQEA